MTDTKHTRANRGFTMMEMLIAVTILIILMALGFIAVQRYQRSMKQLELDNAAKEIFVAAQNHLTLAESQGVLAKRVESVTDASGNFSSSADGVLGTTYTRGGEDYRYWFVSPNDSRLGSAAQANVLKDMLPQFSLDDTVRLGGSYVIEYDADTATVLNVFYSDQSPLSTHDFSTDDTSRGQEALFGAEGYLGEGNKGKRLDGYGNGNAVIGWYGGEDGRRLARETVSAPKIEVINAERLAVKVTFNTNKFDEMGVKGTILLKLTITGEKSGNTKVINVAGGEANGETLSYFSNNRDENSDPTVTGKPIRTYVLDDITTDDQHFYNLWCAGSDPLIPGENVTVQAEVVGKDILTNIARSAAVTTNSIFASAKKQTDEETGDSRMVANVTNIRHLENMDPEVSSYDVSGLDGLDDAGAHVFAQTKDLSWSDFRTKVTKAKNPKATEQEITDLAAEVRVYKSDGVEANASKKGTYLPVEPSAGGQCYLESYDGKDHKISDVVADLDGKVGIFGEVQGAEIRNLKVVNFSGTGTGDAGALAGKAVDCTLEGVIAYNDVEDGESDAALEISGTGDGANAGGLVGSLEGDSTVSQCAAAVYVRSEKAHAGGLVGATTGDVTIESSYAGGHTVDGVFLDTIDPGKEGRINVIGATASGGLVGAHEGSGDLTIKNCYSTASVKGEGAGGLVGSCTSGSITDSYAANLVVDTRTDPNDDDLEICGGGILGDRASSATISGCHYLSIINEGMHYLDGSDADVAGEAEAFDKDANTYNGFVTGTAEAQPYDSVLKERYNGKYPLKTIQDLAGLEDDEAKTYSKEHFGDWPSPEIMVVNE